MTHKSQIIWVQSYGYKSNYFHLKLIFILSLCPYFGAVSVFSSRPTGVSVDAPQLHCCQPSAAHARAHACPRPPSLSGVQRGKYYIIKRAAVT